MIEELEPIVLEPGLDDALKCVRVAQTVAANRARAMKLLPWYGIGFVAGTALWCAAMWTLLPRTPDAASMNRLLGVATFVIAGGMFAKNFSHRRDVPVDKNDEREMRDQKALDAIKRIFSAFVTVLLFPMAFAGILGDMAPTALYARTVGVKWRGDRWEYARVSAVLADVRVRKLLGDLAGQIDAWNLAIGPVNRRIRLTNAEVEALSAAEIKLIAEYRMQGTELNWLIAIASLQLNEGLLGSQPDIDDENPEGMRTRLATLVERNERLLAEYEAPMTIH